NKGVPVNLLMGINHLFDQCLAIVVFGGRQADPIWLQYGLLQGSVLSPLLFNTFIDNLPKKIREITNTESAILFADDIGLLGATHDIHIQQLKACEDFSITNKFAFAPAKCEVLAPPTATEEEKNAIQLYNTLPAVFIGRRVMIG
ncbi:hypothetical protein HK096_010796, partial [Nowakowskiella sp. JEL0078]